MLKKNLSFFTGALVFVLIVSFWSAAFACTDFQVKTTGGDFIIGRSMEFAVDLKPHIFIKPRGEKEAGGAPEGGRGLTWTSKYGYAAVDAFGMSGVAIDGLNEAGLSAEGLWHAEAAYQSVSKRQRNRAVHIARFGAWVLGSFRNVEEVKEAVKNIRVWADAVTGLNMVPPVHFAVHDADGGNIVIEFIAGEIKVYDNPVGVLTNSPSFDWHIENLRNYVNLKVENAGPLTIGGIVVRPAGQGSGLSGIPGDWTPPSRFVRAAMLTNFSDRPKDAVSGVNLAAHILNAVDIPMGAIKNNEKNGAANDHTQWAVIKDLKNRVLYVRDYTDLALRAIDLKKISFEKEMKTKRIPLENKAPRIIDITGDLLN